MEHVHWSLVAVAFMLGLLLTSTLMISPVKHEVRVKKSPPLGAKARPATAKKSAVAKSHPRKPSGARKSPAKTPGVKRSPTAKIPAANESVTEQIPVSTESPNSDLPIVQHAPYGPGSARADADGSGPAGWLVKGRSDTRLYYTPDDSTYDPTLAQVWFQDEEFAVRAFFTPWRKSARRK